MQRSQVLQVRAVCAYLDAVEVTMEGAMNTRDRSGRRDSKCNSGGRDLRQTRCVVTNRGRAQRVRLSYRAMSRCFGCDCGTACSRGWASKAGIGREN